MVVHIADDPAITTFSCVVAAYAGTILPIAISTRTANIDFSLDIDIPLLCSYCGYQGHTQRCVQCSSLWITDGCFLFFASRVEHADVSSKMRVECNQSVPNPVLKVRKLCVNFWRQYPPQSGEDFLSSFNIPRRCVV